MRKTRFFYGKMIMLCIGLAWTGLFYKAMELEMQERQAQLKKLEQQAKKMQNIQAEEEAEKKTQAEEQARAGEAEKTQDEALQKGTEKKIRVLLMNSDYSSYFHPYVTVSAQNGSKTYTPEDVQKEGGTVILEGAEILSVERQEGHPVYEGNVELHASEEGIYMVNELLLESYLKAVVPSEMPASYEGEALKAQAICARTYALKQMEEHKLKSYGADVDDSVNYQVYQNVFPKEATSQAVLDTEGQVLCQNKELIEAYYFSTSSGMTSTDEVWGAQEAASYLKSVSCTFDSEEPFSQWSVVLDWEVLQERAMGYEGCSGALTGIEVVKKSQSGAVTGLRILTEGGEKILSEEYGVRQFLAPAGAVVTGKDGVQLNGGVLLPSAYFDLESIQGESLSIQGGGYGHGVGMSQNGANEMARQGYSCEEILQYFFRDIEITQIEGEVQPETTGK